MELDLKELAEKKADMCAKEIAEVLKKYELLLKPTLVITAEGIVPNVVLAKATEIREEKPSDEATTSEQVNA